jgi:SAM-dependent methyltransferase
MKDSSIVVPLFLDFFQPTSVVDFGCGLGTWLKAFKDNGVKEILGLDGDWCNKDLLYKYIKKEEFKCVDLESPIHLEKEYDLVISLEVAEHLSDASSDIFVQSLVNAGKIILFSAAVPGQGGWNHINEQWPSYWRLKFEKHRYLFHDIIRPKIWNISDVAVCYRQNVFIVAHESIQFPPNEQWQLSADYHIVHPDYFKLKNDYIADIENSKRGVSFYFPRLFKSIVNRLLNKSVNPIFGSRR